MINLPNRFLHGSSTKGIDRLSVTKGRERCPFGPALYLTTDLAVARCYLGNDGVIYELEVGGNFQFTIALNLGWSNQTVEARMAIQKLLKAAKVTQPFHHAKDARSLIELADAAMTSRERNNYLCGFGIWLLYGHVDAYEHSGLCDRGIQYALIDDEAILRQGVYKVQQGESDASFL